MQTEGNQRRQDGADPEARSGNLRDRRKGPRQQKGFVARATARNHSGEGSDSVRPHLRDQLELKDLMAGRLVPAITGIKGQRQRDEER